METKWIKLLRRCVKKKKVYIGKNISYRYDSCDAVVMHVTLRVWVLGLKLKCCFFEFYVVFSEADLMLKLKDLTLCILKIEGARYEKDTVGNRKCKMCSDLLKNCSLLRAHNS